MEPQKCLQKEQSIKQTNKQKTFFFFYCPLKSGPYFHMKLVKLAKQGKERGKGALRSGIIVLMYELLN